MTGIEPLQISRREELVVLVKRGRLGLLEFFRQLFHEAAPFGSWPDGRDEVCADLLLLKRNKEQARAVVGQLNIVDLVLRLDVSEQLIRIHVPNLDDLLVSSE